MDFDHHFQTLLISFILQGGRATLKDGLAEKHVPAQESSEKSQKVDRQPEKDSLVPS